MIGGPKKLKRAPISILSSGTLIIAINHDSIPQIDISTTARNLFKEIFVFAISDRV